MSNLKSAKCYLGEEGDENNSCFISNESLTVIKNSKKNTFPLEWVKQVYFKEKIFLIPIVFGGISASLSALALFQYYFNPWLMLSILFASTLVVYYGIQGGTALVVVTPIKEYDFFLKQVSDNLKAFVAYITATISGIETSYFIELTEEQEKTIQEKSELQLPENGFPLSTSKRKSHSAVFQILFDEPTFEIRYQKDNGGQLSPVIFGTLKMESLRKIEMAD
ncbi:hypothetical protein [Fulvivirga lutea]|uniref:Uncharacterized protein n=1 Tax=Fulvivirga lutea TaxID=2810512 RepID=A0A974WH24_9BACT|nr:hypothetical protein [Fulvivirga lutea]QSE96977.1 hypothetical protein JR347_15470 [Fulvivirga lutea]